MDSGGGGLAAVRVIAERHPVGSFLVAAYVIQLASDIPAAAASRGLLSDTNPALGLFGVLAAVGPALAAVADSWQAAAAWTACCRRCSGARVDRPGMCWC
ncbi:MAG: hypothetical protein KY460_14470 [Actinobacteria bacterium]|nr:hypothetical protein [Actinomycetota bacterium]